MNNGKRKCKMLREIRMKIANEYDLVYKPVECHHRGDCAGTCPKCEAELRDLQLQLQEKGITDVSLSEQILLNIDKNADENALNSDSKNREACAPIVTPEGITPEKEPPEPLQGIALPTGYLDYEGDDDNDDNDEGDDDSVDNDEGDDEKSTISMQGDVYIPPYFVNPSAGRTLFKECPLAGISFYNDDEIWDELDEGVKLALVRDKNNRHDENAVAVALEGDYDGNPDDFDFDFILGYIPRNQNKEIAAILDMGWDNVLECEIESIKRYGPYKERIRLAIYLKNKEEEPAIKERLLRVSSIDKEEYDSICKDLYDRGFAHFRWGGFPPWTLNLPKENENVVFLYKVGEKYVLYLMHLIAVGEHVVPFLKDKSNLDWPDDCSPYLFTNVKGPVVAHCSDLKFLKEEYLCKGQPERYLPKDASDKLNDFFDGLT